MVAKGGKGKGTLGPLRYAGAPVAGTSEVQTITFGGTPTGGTIQLALDGIPTAAIAWSATNNTLRDNVDAALEALPNVGTGNVAVTVGTMTAGIGTLLATFGGALAKKAISTMSVASNALTGTAPTVAVTETTPGVDATYRGAAKGALLVDYSTPALYQNTGTSTVPIWSLMNNAELAALLAALPTAAVADITSSNLTAWSASANLTAVPGTFADEAAVQTYLATLVGELETRLDGVDTGAALIISQTETRLDALEAKINDALAKLRTGGVVTP